MRQCEHFKAKQTHHHFWKCPLSTGLFASWLLEGAEIYTRRECKIFVHKSLSLKIETCSSFISPQGGTFLNTIEQQTSACHLFL